MDKDGRYNIRGVFHPGRAPSYELDSEPYRFKASLLIDNARETRIITDGQKYPATRVIGSITDNNGESILRGSKFSIDGKDFFLLHQKESQEDPLSNPQRTYLLTHAQKDTWVGTSFPYGGKVKNNDGLIACLIQNGASSESGEKLLDPCVPDLLRRLAKEGKIKLPEGFPEE